MQLLFDRACLDLERRLLQVEGQAVDVQPLVFDLLSFLARHPRRAVSKTELLAAVWRSSFVTDSVVARAIMKARRAIQDDPVSPRMLRTVPRVGYMLDSDVAEGRRETAGAQSNLVGAVPIWAILPFEMQDEDSADSWMRQGLMGMLSHLLERSASMALVPPAEVNRVLARAPPGTRPLDFVRSQLNATYVVACCVRRDGPQWALSAWLNAHPESQPFHLAQGTDLQQLLEHLVGSILTDRVFAPGMPGDPFWMEQLAKVIGLGHSGQAAQALALLEVTLPDLQPSTSLDLLYARLLLQAGRVDDAAGVVTRAMDLSATETVLIQLRDLLAQCHYESDRLSEARAEFGRALADSLRLHEAAHLRPEILCRAANVASRMGNATAAIELSEQAVAEANHLGSVEGRARAWLNLASVMIQMDQLFRAEFASERAIELAHRSGDTEYQARSWRLQANIQNYRRHHSDALISIRRSIALWVRCGVVSMEVWARLMELVILVESDRIELALQQCSALSGHKGMQAPHQSMFLLVQALIAWKSGQESTCIESLEAVGQVVTGGHRTMSHMIAHGELVFQYIHLGQLEPARRSLGQMVDMPTLGAVERRRAAIALASGDRSAAKALLLGLWRADRVKGLEGTYILLDLMWLLLEDAHSGRDNLEMETIYAHVLDLSEEPLVSRLVREAYVLRLHPDSEHLVRWSALVGTSAILAQRCPILVSTEFPGRWIAGTAPKLNELVSRACW